MKMKLSRRYVYIFAGIAVLIALLLWVHPIAFIKTGILTKEKVDQYEKQYDLGMSLLLQAGMDASAIALGIMFIGSLFRVIKIKQERSHKHG